MPRGKAKPKAKGATNELLSAISFVGSVLKEQGSPNETHIILSNKWAVAFNGILAAGSVISWEGYAAPNFNLFQAAIAKCGEEFSIEAKSPTNEDIIPGQNSNIYVDKLIIKSNKFRAIVPCLDPSLLNVSGIDEKTHSINNQFIVALEATGPLASENGQKIHYCSILMNGKSLVSSENGTMIFEWWHGCDLPSGIALPKSLVPVLTKSNKKLVGFGHSNSSVTFYFDDNSWIKSQLFSEQWPDITGILNVQSNPFETPKDLWEGLQAIGPHSVDGLVYFDSSIIRSHPNDMVGASYEVKGLPKGPIFSIKQLEFIQPYAKQIDFFANGLNGKITAFYGDKCRGIIAGRSQ
jgi:hypothetical protein